jgi:hypothetical protein
MPEDSVSRKDREDRKERMRNETGKLFGRGYLGALGVLARARLSAFICVYQRFQND